MRYFFILFACLFTFSFQAQEKSFYSYLTDKKFKKTNDIFGFEFVPNVMEIPGTKGKDLKAGDYKFRIDRENLFVSGGEIAGVYNINNVNTTDYGFKLELMDARDPGKQGHLKVILLNKKYVDALVFKESNFAKEVIFFLPEIDEALRTKEKEYFTDRSEILLEFADEIWGTNLYPFYRVYAPKRVHKRVQMSDGVKIEFLETETIIEKTKTVKIKAEKPKKEKKKKEEEEEIVAEVEEEIKEESPIEAEEEVDEETSLFDSFFGDDDEEEEVVEEVVGEAPSEELVPENEDIKQYFGEDTEEEVVKKVKYEYIYEIKLTDTRPTDSGFDEPFTKSFKVKNVKLRQDPNPRNPYYTYQVEFETNKGSVHLYLGNDKKISTMDFGAIEYLMRGH